MGIIKGKIWNQVCPGHQKLLASICFLEYEFYTLNEYEFQNHKVVLNVINNVTSLITYHIQKARSITRGKVSTFQGDIFLPPKEKAGALKSDLGLPPNSLI